MKKSLNLLLMVCLLNLHFKLLFKFHFFALICSIFDYGPYFFRISFALKNKISVIFFSDAFSNLFRVFLYDLYLFISRKQFILIDLWYSSFFLIASAIHDWYSISDPWGPRMGYLVWVHRLILFAVSYCNRPCYNVTQLHRHMYLKMCYLYNANMIPLCIWLK